MRGLKLVLKRPPAGIQRCMLRPACRGAYATDAGHLGFAELARAFIRGGCQVVNALV
jgi:hypothetical protein